ncbi:hypothetical protein [Actinomadura kijaniata]|uniref:hypothetical protein n=1 Tax=Actinomadura kijaniata TaxID=46161 RepID=UPI00082BB443|nr:hypothetical protein [Actinomadura kijaniata]
MASSAAPAVRVTGTVTVEYNRFTVAAPGASPGCLDLPRNGLVGAPLEARPFEAGTVAVIATGVAYDEVAVTAEVWTGEPPALDTTGWQDAAVITVDWPGGQVRLLGEDTVPPSELPLGGLPAGRYRLLVAGRHRDEGEARSGAMPVEEYLIRLWPASSTGERVLKATSATGAMWRGG